MADVLKIAVAQYEIQHLESWNAYEDKIISIVETAHHHQAQLLTLGEYAGLEIAGWATLPTLQHQFEHIQTYLNQYKNLFSSLAKKYNLYIQPGSLPVLEKDNHYRNRAFLFAPNGKISHQDKIFLTPFEIDTHLFQSGDTLNLFATDIGNIGITICYDIEFPELAKKLTHANAQLILSPSCTERLSGLTRVTISGRARAIESQCFVVHACLIGTAPWCDFIDINTGQSGIYSPADRGFPDNGILAQSALNSPDMIFADLATTQLSRVREAGEMRNHQDSKLDISAILQTLHTVQMV